MTFWGNAAADWAWICWRLRLAWARHAERHARWCLQVAMLSADPCGDAAEIDGLAAVAVYATNHRRQLELAAP